ncbi:M23 family metallopeptidase [Paracoccus aminophilus]|uniref:Peptidase M23 n=1 Tax=Paracoccus aminophilus JCM 7686 TaxID=1367847 RepID=S5Z243_PARAH|nr:M23 family metallopeptidase [Paracoccus aminophilus]AGT11476.1 peptidase M23 [Paracoccus aminophilus JCM 7686]
MIDIDPQFRKMGSGARRRRQRLGLVRGAALALALVGAGAGIWHFLPGRAVDGGDLDQQIVQTESEFDIAPVVRGDAFTDIAGDPMIIPGEEASDEAGRQLSGPTELSPIRVGQPAPDRLTLVAEDLYQRGRRLVAALPTTREEFALFQAERSRDRQLNASGAAGLPDGAGVSVDAEGRQSSSVAFIRDSGMRSPLWQDLLLQIRVPSDIVTLLTDNGFDRTTAERVQARMVAQLQIRPELPRGSLLALRYRLQAGAREVLQLSLYESGRYVGSLAVGAAGQLVTGADPWTDQPLLDQSGEDDEAGDRPQYRLLDVIYSAALRNGVPSPVIGEAIALMAKVQDLDAFAAEGDQLKLVYANRPGPGADAAGQVLFIGVTGPSGTKSCYVVPRREGGYECYAPGARVVVADQPGMATPVSGVLSTRFSPPAGGKGGVVVWQAPQGAAVSSVTAGRVAEVTGADAAGSTVRIDHADGLSSLYLGLADLDPAVRPGADLAGGAMLGKVASGAGLTFQLTKSGKPVDPVPYLTGGTEVLASNAVELLISRIIHVESGGNVAAKNPLSTATGLGQFIEGTWLRMMSTYRPDLVQSMDRGQLLDLRLEPALSRQMVRALAQENEAFLRARGHQITPGNLYLAHFLGPLGASQVLSADPEARVGDVMGQGVVSANPFLSGYTIADLRNWAARKMSATGVSAAVPEAMPVKASPEVERFVALMDAILAPKQP